MKPSLRSTSAWITLFIFVFVSPFALCRREVARAQEKPPPAIPAASATAAPQGDGTRAEAPFEYDPPIRPYLVVRARVNTSEPLRFVVDTGSNFDLLLAPWAENALGLKPIGAAFRIQPGGLRGHFVEGGTLQLQTLNGGRTPFAPLKRIAVADVSFMRESYGPEIAGIIGGSLLRTTLCTIDFDKKVLSLLEPASGAVTPARNAIVLPMQWPAAPPQPPRVMVGLSPPISADFIVDTGSSITNLPSEQVGAVSIVGAGSRIADLDAGGARASTAYLAKQILLGGTSVPLLPFAAVEGVRYRLLGLDVLSRFRVTFDSVHGRLVLEPRSNAPPLIPGDAGIRCTFDDGEAAVRKVLHPAALRAGVMIGDRILEIDGKPVAGLPHFQIGGMIGGVAGTWLDLAVQKTDGSRARIRLLRRSPYPGVVPAVHGLFLNREGDGAWRALYVLPGSASEKAGVNPGDELVMLNGKAVREMDPETIEETLSDTGAAPSLLHSLILKRKQTGAEITLSGR